MAWTQWRVGGSVVDLKWSPDGQKLAALTREGLFVLTAEGAPAWSVKRRFSTRNTAAWSPDGTRLAAAERGIRVWTADGEEVTTLGGGSEVIVAWLDDLWIVAGTLGMAYDTRRTMRPWNVDTGEAGWTVRLDDADGSVEGLAVTPDGMHVVAGGNDDGSWTVLNAQDGTQAHQSWSHSPSIVQFSPDGSRMVCAVGREVSVGTSAEPPFATFRLTGSAEVEGLALAPDGRALAVAGGGRVSIRDAESRVEQHGLEVAATRLAWSPDGRLLAAATADGVQAFDAAGWCGTLQEPVARPPSGVVPFELDARAAAKMELVELFAEVMSEESDDAREDLAFEFSSELDDWLEAWPSESLSTFAMAVAEVLAEADGGEAEEMHAQVMADLMGVRALADQ